MNWLAHLALSEPSAEFRLGNLLPDFLGIADLSGFSGDFRRGIECHRRIDAFTDSHAIVRQSKGRIDRRFEKFAGILVDIFYDHILSRDWHRYSEAPVEELIGAFYASIDTHRASLPGTTAEKLDAMRTENWLGSYREKAGIEKTLRRLSARLSKPVDLAASLPDLEKHYDAFQQDFHTFFPLLKQHVALTRPPP